MSRLATALLALSLSACITHDVVELGPDGNSCIDPNTLSHRQYSQAFLSRTETSAKLSFSLTGYTSDEARLSFTPYLSDPVTEALRDYAAAHPRVVTPAEGGLKKVNAWYDPVHSTTQHTVLVSNPDLGWFLVEPRVLAKNGDGGFFVECPAAAKGAECIRHHNIAGRTVEIGMTDTDLQHWADADKALRTAVQSLLAPCMP